MKGTFLAFKSTLHSLWHTFKDKDWTEQSFTNTQNKKACKWLWLWWWWLDLTYEPTTFKRIYTLKGNNSGREIFFPFWLRAILKRMNLLPRSKFILLRIALVFELFQVEGRKFPTCKSWFPLWNGGKVFLVFPFTSKTHFRHCSSWSYSSCFSSTEPLGS